jgi:anaerobic selenocysteine-containing dehydrogenase
MTLQQAVADYFEGSRRRLRIPTDVAARLKIRDGDLVEVVADSCGATLRGWAMIDDKVTQLSIGPRGMEILGGKSGEQVEVRAVPTHPV